MFTVDYIDRNYDINTLFLEVNDPLPTDLTGFTTLALKRGGSYDGLLPIYGNMKYRAYGDKNAPEPEIRMPNGSKHQWGKNQPNPIIMDLHFKGGDMCIYSYNCSGMQLHRVKVSDNTGAAAIKNTHGKNHIYSKCINENTHGDVFYLSGGCHNSQIIDSDLGPINGGSGDHIQVIQDDGIVPDNIKVLRNTARQDAESTSNKGSVAFYANNSEIAYNNLQGKNFGISLAGDNNVTYQNIVELINPTFGWNYGIGWASEWPASNSEIFENTIINAGRAIAISSGVNPPPLRENLKHHHNDLVGCRTPFFADVPYT